MQNASISNCLETWSLMNEWCNDMCSIRWLEGHVIRYLPCIHRSLHDPQVGRFQIWWSMLRRVSKGVWSKLSTTLRAAHSIVSFRTHLRKRLCGLSQKPFSMNGLFTWEYRCIAWLHCSVMHYIVLHHDILSYSTSCYIKYIIVRLCYTAFHSFSFRFITLFYAASCYVILHCIALCDCDMHHIVTSHYI